MEPSDRISKGLSFDDVLLRPAHSSVLPRDVRLQTTLTRRLTMNIPLVSAAMDTVTEARLAIALAQEGGMGIVHKNLSIDDQAKEVDRVKRSQAGIITDPFTLTPITSWRTPKTSWRATTSPACPSPMDGDLVGILTNRDMRFEEDLSKPILGHDAEGAPGHRYRRARL
jgi:IMP dehydrogenase